MNKIDYDDLIDHVKNWMPVSPIRNSIITALKQAHAQNKEQVKEIERLRAELEKLKEMSDGHE